MEVVSHQTYDWQERIISDDSGLLGKPAIRGTRISVEFVLERLADGWTEQQRLENYPRLTHDDLTAEFSYVAECMKDGLLFVKPVWLRDNEAFGKRKYSESFS
ncbi:MAG: DUF433 domain-containing protein [Acidobacteriota bacterium]|nr:DUF433 domain-containing protein [Acidobacteriota bacterium]